MLFLLNVRDVSLKCTGDEFPRRLLDPQPPVTALLYYRWFAAGFHDKITSQRQGGHRVYVGIRHPKFTIRLKCGKPGHKNGNSGFPGKS